MGDSLITIVAIVLAALLMFIFPLMSVSERNDDIAQLAVQTAATEFIDEVRTTGNITEQSYNKLVETLSATGNSYDVELEVKKLDENPGKKTTWTEGDKIGENLYYSVYTSTILNGFMADIDGDGEPDEKYQLKKGDQISVTVKNTNKTIAQSLRSFFYSESDSNAYQIAAQHNGIVMANGK